MKARVFEKLLYRHWNAYSSSKVSHLFVVPVSGGVPQDITPGAHDVPPFSLGGQDFTRFLRTARSGVYQQY